MNDIERRLHHAARELRSVAVELPPLGAPATERVPPGRRSGVAGRVPALVMPVLFVLGGLAVLTGGLGRTTDPPAALPPAATVAALPAEVADPGEVAAAAAPAVSTATTGRVPNGPALTAHQEIALIAALAPTPPLRPDADPAGQLRTLAQTYH